MVARVIVEFDVREVHGDEFPPDADCESVVRYACRQLVQNNPDITGYVISAWNIERARLEWALQEIWEASRDAGLQQMCNWMRGRAAAALSGEDRDRYEAHLAELRRREEHGPAPDAGQSG